MKTIDSISIESASVEELMGKVVGKRRKLASGKIFAWSEWWESLGRFQKRLITITIITVFTAWIFRPLIERLVGSR